MGYIKPIPVKPEDIEVGNKYYTCSYSGAITVTVIEIFDKENKVLVKVKNNKCKPFIRNMNYNFDNSRMAKCAGRSWESSRKRKKSKS